MFCTMQIIAYIKNTCNSNNNTNNANEVVTWLQMRRCNRLFLTSIHSYKRGVRQHRHICGNANLLPK